MEFAGYKVTYKKEVQTSQLASAMRKVWNGIKLKGLDTDKLSYEGYVDEKGRNVLSIWGTVN